MIAAGLKLYGFIPELHALAKGLFEATGLFDLGRLPETFGGHPRDRQHPPPGIYPKACAPQAWSAGAVVQMIQALLGLVPLAPFDLLAVDPDLPEWLPEVTLEGLRVGDSTVSLAFRRDASGLTDYRILAAQGPVRVERQALARFGGVA